MDGSEVFKIPDFVPPVFNTTLLDQSHTGLDTLMEKTTELSKEFTAAGKGDQDLDMSFQSDSSGVASRKDSIKSIENLETQRMEVTTSSPARRSFFNTKRSLDVTSSPAGIKLPRVGKFVTSNRLNIDKTLTTNQRQSKIGKSTEQVLKSMDLVERWRWSVFHYGPEIVAEFKARKDAAAATKFEEISPEIFDQVINDIIFMHKCILDNEYYSEIKSSTGAVGCIIPACPHYHFYTWAKDVVEDPQLLASLSNQAGNKIGRINYSQFEAMVYHVSKPQPINDFE